MMGDAIHGGRIVTLLLVTVLVSHPSYGREKMDIHSMHIQAKVTSRFARTLITMVIQNPSNVSQEAIFDVELPKTAFITTFSMTVDNVTTVGTVKEKTEAKKQYQKAVSRGQSAGLVQSTGRKMEHFKISVNVGSLAKVTFKLTYEELLKRQLGKYELNIRVRPLQLVEDFQITVDITEPQGISFLKADGTFTSNDLMDLVKINRTESQAHVEFRPTVDQQRRCPGCPETLVDGDLMLRYDVKREDSAGRLQVVNGYFVHYFAPPSLSRIPKNVVFIIDRSGSMYGTKIKQTYEAFIKILGDVPEEDHFGLLIFDDKVEEWNKQLVKAVPENIEKAKKFVSGITARGGTDINKVLLTAAKMLINATINNMLPEISASIIIFLSDGEPTSGTTDHSKIIDNLKRSLEGRASLYCLGFGSDVDYKFLERLALENGGLARRIYEDSDSALQLQGFYNEVAYPMLLDVHLQYLENSVDYLTQNNFRHYYQGSEIIVAGHIADNSLDVLTAEITAKGVSEPFSVKVNTDVKEAEEVEKEQQYIFSDFTERLWAYLTIEQMLTQQISLDGEEKQRVTEKALNLSLKYHFVTPLTSMVVTPPEDEDANKQLVANKPKEGEQGIAQDDIKVAAAIDSHYYVDYDAEVEYDAEVDLDFMGAARLIQAAPDRHVHKAHVKVYADSTAPPSFHRIPLPTYASPRPPPKSVCGAFHLLLRIPQASERICVGISKADGAHVNLFHDAGRGITLNAKLADDKSFERLGLLSSTLGTRAEITEDNVTVIHGNHVTTYSWDSAFQKDGFLKKEGENILTELQVGVRVAIFRVERALGLSLFVEDQHSPSQLNDGIIGQLLCDNKTLTALSLPPAADTDGSNYQSTEIVPIRFTGCDFSPYGVGDRTSCLFIAIDASNLIGGKSNIVSDIFATPQRDHS